MSKLISRISIGLVGVALAMALFFAMPAIDKDEKASADPCLYAGVGAVIYDAYAALSRNPYALYGAPTVTLTAAGVCLGQTAYQQSYYSSWPSCFYYGLYSCGGSWQIYPTQCWSCYTYSGYQQYYQPW